MDKEKKNASSILVLFNNEKDGGRLDALDSATLDAADFNVVGNTGG